MAIPRGSASIPCAGFSLLLFCALGCGGVGVAAVDGTGATLVGGSGRSVGVVVVVGAASVATTVFGARRVSAVEIREENRDYRILGLRLNQGRRATR